MKKLLFVIALLLHYSVIGTAQTTETVSLKNECYQTLSILSPALLDLQIQARADSNFGGLQCKECNVFHTRAGEAVYPFTVMFKQSKDKKYLRAAIELGNWLIRQQKSGGEWLETPWTWTGTTADQLLMMSLSYPIVEPHLSKQEKGAWRTSIEHAADYLVKNMSPDFATINYCATTPASLAATNQIFPSESYLQKARLLSRQVLSKMNTDGFIEGEAARVGKIKYGVDPGYEFDMSSWGLIFYARLTGDSVVYNRIRTSVAEHLNLVYPDGIIDGSWGTRCYKWTTFGSKTADGCQILFSLLAKEDARYRTAAMRNLTYLRTMIHNGVIGSGPQYFDLLKNAPCNYPTFARSKNLALAIEFGDQGEGVMSRLPTEETGMLKVYPTVNIAVARTENILATISAYQYVDYQNWGQGRYSQFPSGGSACNIWLKDFGLLQTSSPTRYIRGEVIHMPDIQEPIRPHTPRFEYSDSGRFITNLYDRKGIMSSKKIGNNQIVVSVSGEMCDDTHLPNGVSYSLTHLLQQSSIQKEVTLTYHDKNPDIKIVEPVVFEEGMEVIPDGNKRVLLKYKNKKVVFELMSGDAELVLGENKEQYWQPFPALRCYPIILNVQALEHPFENENFQKEIVYRFIVE